MKKIYSCLFVVWAILLATSCSTGSKYAYESVPGDPLLTRIYTLDNGLKVYLSVNKDKPRIQTFIGVRVGGKNDPAETTGLAHYFEHLMFKGTKNFGTTDYESEKILLDQIEALFESYRQTTDEAERKALYAQIDSVSQEASKIAIPNEYDKLMSAIGSQGTNAFTSYDVTAYMEDIPSNEVESWAKIQSDRFTNPVIRLFHTELETVYEEYNMSLTRDGRKVYETILSSLFPHHPYGTQTVLGTQEHLKNPSITNIKNYFDTYYVPNNMAICMVGDLNPDETIQTLEQYFGALVAKELPPLKTTAEQPITAPVVKEVIGLEAENITIAYRLPAANTKDAAVMEFIDYLLTNGKAGLIDLNLVQKQKVLRAGSGTNPMADYSIFELYGTPKEGQTLEEVKDLLLEQIDLLRKGEFDDELLQAVINNFRLEQYYQQQEYQYAAQILLFAFVNGTDWKDQVEKIDVQSKITKQDVIDFCNKYYTDNYVVVYKREGKPDDKKIDKPAITPISTNRDSESAFLASFKAREVKPIEPVFLDYDKDLSKLKVKNTLPLLYKQNTSNPLFSLYYVFEMGNNHNKSLGTAFNYLNYLGTSTKTAEEIKSELYKLACSFGVQATNERVYVYVSGLSDNFDQALAILEERLADSKADAEAYNNLVGDILKSRTDAKLNQSANFSALSNYAIWGAKSPSTNLLSEAELKTLNPEDLVNMTKNLKNFEHTILYYGPLTETQITETLNKNHATGESLQAIPAPTPFVEQETTESKVLLAHYDAKQIYMAMLHKGGSFDQAIEAGRTMYNTYFGGSMNSIVFQEMREARGLAYTARAGYQRPGKPERAYYLQTFIATQNDKLKDAISAFQSILNDMPESENAFKLAKENILTDIRTERILRDDILWNYLSAKEFGYETDSRKELFEKIPGFTLTDVKTFQQQYIKDKPLTYCILGDTKDLDMKTLQELGPITILKQEDIFGY
ncbi:MAG: insulinase family protein [Tannerellaceae bacterium]|jgi:predicted Zn-dependent peptidase|nr:insulinase family protein [Tannerellaceae bacterium]